MSDNNENEITTENENEITTENESTTENETTTEENNVSFTDSLKDIFTEKNMILIAAFLGIYFIAYFVMGQFTSGQSQQTFNLSLSRTLDMLFLLLITGIFSIRYLLNNFFALPIEYFLSFNVIVFFL